MPPGGLDPIARLALQLGRLPGIGERSAQRLAYYLLKTSLQKPAHVPSSLVQDLAAALLQAEAEVVLCERCCNLAASALCAICADPKRQRQQLCIVGEVADLRALEAAGIYSGLYHVLHGKLSPLEGIGPDALQIPSLLARLTQAPPQEVILAMSHDVEGETTALYLADQIRPLNLRITRLASGIPLGGELEYIDKATLGRALSERREFLALPDEGF